MKHSVLFILLLTLISMSAYGQLITVTGTVKNDKGEILAAATVAEKGVTNTTLSDADGNFRIQVRPDAVIVVSYKGLKTREFRVSVNDIQIIAELPSKWSHAEIGFALGANYCFDAKFKIQNKNTQTPAESYVKPYIGFHGGISACCNFKEHFAGEFGILFSLKGVREEEVNYKGVSNLYYLTMPFPFLSKFRVDLGESRLYFIIGPEMGVLLSSKIKETFGDKERTWSLELYPSVTPGAMCGISFESKIGLGLQFGYDLTFQNSDKNYLFLHTAQCSLIYRVTKRN